jgi:signal transduction histidine kinase
MKIRWRLNIISLLALTAFLILFIYIHSITRIIEEELAELEKINQFEEDISQLIVSTEYYLSNKNPRYLESMQKLYDKIIIDIKNIPDFLQFKLAVQALKGGENAFYLVLRIDSEPENYPNIKLREELRERAKINIRTELRQLMSLSYTISKNKLQYIRDLQSRQRENYLMVMFPSILLITFSTFINGRHILLALDKLRTGALQMANGNLSHRIKLGQKDELGELAEKFNDMAVQLQLRTEKEKELVRNLEKNSKKIEMSNKELEQFAYVASHDLQEPLRMITGFLSRLEDKYSEKLDGKAKQYIHFAMDGAKRMRTLILDLLEFSRVGKHEEKLQEIELMDLLFGLKQVFESQLQETGGDIILPKSLPAIKGYPYPLRQIFQNLISNAIKYHREGLPPQVEIHFEESGKFWQFSVKDNGIGIEDEYREKIFEIFHRLRQNNMLKGTGIGLAIVKKNVAHLGGEITLVSTPGKGSTFYFTVPKNPENRSN